MAAPPSKAPAKGGLALDAALTSATGPVTTEQVVELQRLAGNQAVAALMATQRRPLAALPLPARSAQPAAREVVVSRDACCKSCAGGGGCESATADDRETPTVQRLSWNDVTNAASNVGRGVANAASSAAGAVGNAARGAAGAVGNAARSAVGAASNAARSAVGAASNAARSVVGGLANAGRAIGGAAASLVPDWVKNLFSSAPAQSDQQKARADQQTSHASREAETTEQKEKTKAQAAAKSNAKSADQRLEHQNTQMTTGYADTDRRSAVIKGAAVGTLTTLGVVAAPALVPFVNPAIALARPAVLDAAAARIGSAGAQVAGAVGQGVAPGLRQAGSAFDGYTWNCDFAEIASRAGNVGRGVFNAAVGLADVASQGRASKALAFASNLAGKVRSVGDTVKGKVRAYAGRLKTFLGDKIRPVMDAAKALGSRVKAGVERVAGQVRQFAGQARDLAVSTFNAAKARVTERVQAIGAGLRNAGTALMGKIRQGLQIAGAVIDILFPGARGLLAKIQAGIEAGLAKARALAQTVKAKLIAAKDNVVAFVKAKADEALRNAIRLGQKIGEKLSKAKKWILDHKAQIIMAIPGGPMIAAIGGAAMFIGGKVRQAAAAVAKKASGVACAAAEVGGGPCVNQYLPNPGAGQSASITMSSTMDVTLPLHEIGVPCSVKLGKGAEVTIKRSGDTFTVGIKGDSSATAVENLEASASGTASVALPSGGSGSVWKRLGGAADNAPGQLAGPATPALAGKTDLGSAAKAAAGAAAPTASQVGGQAAGGTGAGGSAGAGSPGASFEAGVKGTLEQEYKFDAKGNACNGLGGMLALTAGLGVASRLPEPLSSLANAGVQSGFLPQLQSSTFTSSAQGSASIKLFEAGGAASAVKITAELSAAAGRRRANEEDDKVGARKGAAGADGFIDELTLAGKLAVEGSLTIPGMGPISGLSASITPEVSVALTLLYHQGRGRIEPEKAEAKLKIDGKAGQIDLSALALLLPGPGGSVAVDRLRRFAQSDGEASVSIKTSIAVNNLDALYVDMEKYFASPDTVTVGGTIDLVKKHLGEGLKRETTVTVTRTSTTSVALGGQVTAEGATIGGNVGASLAMGVETQIYPAT